MRKMVENMFFLLNRDILKNRAVAFGMTALFILGVAVCHAEDESWKFARISDCQGGFVRTGGEIAKAIVQEKVDLVIVAGDLDNRGSDVAYKRWREVMSPIYQAGIPVYPVRGNHDAAGGGKTWKDAFGADIPDNGPTNEVDFTYFVTNKNALFIGIDVYVNTNRSHRVNQGWLDKVIAKNTLPHVFVYAHEPAFKVLHADCLGAYPEDRNKFWETLKRAGCRVYFCGHDHVVDHARIDDGDGNPDNDIHQYVGSTAGGSVYHGGNYDGKNAPYVPVRVFHEEHGYSYLVGEIRGAEVKICWKYRVKSNVFEQVGTWNYTVPGVKTGPAQ
ncbi:MAG: metallophosphoesterase [Verrucomicrobia bacterium]|nr:metallophosphoesterase [Verrucomicrobiota bacterium]MBU1735156.1 metallophosphoesterase [Verrucomicrobiota bacterium]MBU1856439.1 metallophosphoesterase [Verrucomicrobiota bacterium]